MEVEEPFDFVEANIMRKHANAILAPMGLRLPDWPSEPPKAEGMIHHPNLGIEIPWGSLFYPCCGDDLEVALQLFSSYVSTCHFADAYRLPGSQFRETRRSGRPEAIQIPHLCRMVIAPPSRIEGYNCPILLHKKDGLLTLLMDVGPLSVFYYRGDGVGEGGSEQLWLAPLLRDLLVARLLEGGLIVTDGSNGGKDLMRGRQGDVIVHRNRRLTCITSELPASREYCKMCVWQVTTP